MSKKDCELTGHFYTSTVQHTEQTHIHRKLKKCHCQVTAEIDKYLKHGRHIYVVELYKTDYKIFFLFYFNILKKS